MFKNRFSIGRLTFWGAHNDVNVKDTCIIINLRKICSLVKINNLPIGVHEFTTSFDYVSVM